MSALKEQRLARQNRQAELLKLADLLADSESIFLSQNYQARRLLVLLRERLGQRLDEFNGYDRTFYALHDEFNQDEKELQRIIRGTTMNSLRRVNEQMLEWIERNRQFLRPTSDPLFNLFSQELRQLAEHLRQWHDKYAAWVPGDERRSLIYLSDERKDGTQFPKGLDNTLRKVLGQKSSKTSEPKPLRQSGTQPRMLQLHDLKDEVPCPYCGKLQKWHVSVSDPMAIVPCNTCGRTVEVRPPGL